MNKKQIRLQFRNAVFDRDGHKCVFCDETNNLDAHHITNRNEMPNGGYVAENGITLCFYHHRLVENIYMSGVESGGPFHPDSLYEIIKSNKELAIKKSEEML